ncbi:ABC transporter permease [Lachnospiraceae bacterium oral taxon 500]|nr:ABC transporter permease [Lachnospiraceae bacterium oral taxon 500]
MDLNFILTVVNSALRSTTPIMMAALASAICTRAGVFNVALEGQMLIGSFVGIAVNWLTHSTVLAVLAAVVAGGLVGVLVAVLQVRFNAADIVIGTSVNLLVGALTSILLFVIFGVKGSFKNPALIPLHKVKLPVISQIPYLSTLFGNLSLLDYLAYGIAVVMFIYLFKTVSGYHMLSVGVKREAAESMGISALRLRIISVIVSGCLCGFGGVALSMGQVTLFTENMTAGRGFIGMAACNLGQNNPVLIVIASMFFGFCDTFASIMQNRIPAQLTQSVPYISTILALIVFSRKRQKRTVKQ